MRDKRIMTLTAVTAVGNRDLAEIQINAALLNEELTETELKEMAVFLTHYLGFPLGSALNGAVDSVVAKRKKLPPRGPARTRSQRRGALKMHTANSRLPARVVAARSDVRLILPPCLFTARIVARTKVASVHVLVIGWPGPANMRFCWRRGTTRRSSRGRRTGKAGTAAIAGPVRRRRVLR